MIFRCLLVFWLFRWYFLILQFSRNRLQDIVSRLQIRHDSENGIQRHVLIIATNSRSIAEWAEHDQACRELIIV